MKIKSPNILKIYQDQVKFLVLATEELTPAVLKCCGLRAFHDPFSWQHADTEPGPEGHSDKIIGSIHILQTYRQMRPNTKQQNHKFK